MKPLARSSRVGFRFWWRILWVAILLFHAPATLNALAALCRFEHGGRTAGSFALLAISNLFFVLEIVFASTHRLLSNRRSALVFLLVLVLLHANVIEQRMHVGIPESWTVCLWIVPALVSFEWSW